MSLLNFSTRQLKYTPQSSEERQRGRQMLFSIRAHCAEYVFAGTTHWEYDTIHIFYSRHLQLQGARRLTPYLTMLRRKKTSWILEQDLPQKLMGSSLDHGPQPLHGISGKSVQWPFAKILLTRKTNADGNTTSLAEITMFLIR